jgi:hypothetical protein
MERAPSHRGPTRFVAAVLPKTPKRVLKVEDKTFLTAVPRGLQLAGFSTRRRQYFYLGDGVLFCLSEKVPSSPGSKHFVAAALPETPIYALKLGDRTLIVDVLHGP